MEKKGCILRELDVCLSGLSRQAGRISTASGNLAKTHRYNAVKGRGGSEVGGGCEEVVQSYTQK